MTDRFDQLSPRDTAITLRSLGRRIRQAIKPVAQSADLLSLVDAIGASTRSLSELVDEGARTQGLLVGEIHKSLDHEQPIISAAALDPSERSYVEDRPIPLDVALDSIADDSEACGLKLEGASASELARSVRVVGGASTNPLVLGREAARSGINLLNQVEEHVKWLQTQAR